MAPITNVVVFGGGGNSIGRFIVDALLEDGSFRVSVLSRKSSKSTYPSGVRNIRVDDEQPHDQLVAALNGQDAVISAVGFGGGAVPAQTKLIDAAIEAGVKRFIPSEWGFDNADPKASWLSPVFKEKAEIEQYLTKKVKENPAFSWTAVATSIWLEWALGVGFISIDPVKHTVSYWDNGSSTPTVSTLPYSAKSVVECLKHPAETKNKRVFLNPLTASQREVVSELEKQQGVTYTELEPVVGSKAVKEAHERIATSGGSDLGAAYTTVTAQILVEEYGSNFKKAGKGPILEELISSMPKITLSEVVSMVVEKQKKS